jgi:anti-sigma regulatory factor (Ser/Thr protein kinase)
MPRPDRSDEINVALLAALPTHPRDLVNSVAGQMGLSRARVNMQARQLVADGYLTPTGTTRPVYAPGPPRRFTRIYPRRGLAEDRVWSEDLRPLLHGLPRNVLNIAQHGITEMVNNAVDHSGTATVTVHMDCNAQRLLLGVSDEGVGIFHKIARALALPDKYLALLELSKGKLTTAPAEHSGEGIFFTARMFDHFQIFSGGLRFDLNHDQPIDLFTAFGTDIPATGTAVWMQIARDSKRQIKAVFDAYSSGPDDYEFAKTVVPVRLARIGDENLIARSQAKRLLQRVDRFRSVILDFTEVTSIGQAFADEIFRVFANAHPDVELIATQATPEVQQMIRRAQALRDEESANSAR